MVFYSPTAFSFLTLSSLTSFISLLCSLFSLCGSWFVVLVTGLCTTPISARCRSLYSSSVTSLARLISLLSVTRSLYSLAATLLVMAEIWSNFGFCGVVFEFLVVDAVVFLGFMMNLWVSVGHQFWVLSFVDAVVFWVCESL